ncbi:YpjP family protein [Mesobacillus maritimus]|uniref:YpjP family protein n=1 Tax=Mesobacillus maritimus TaxID=1643336 RepID=UPI00203D47E1|nr:YpjP family protein [Mesobacillus maritimus]MCM3588647.1 YpjP family protein [Mesobacillus maritimus]MCM3671830.1 YpjP family protein [Mesobacillus maritimus]
MPLWLRNSLVVLISIITFGLVSPAQASELLSLEPKTNHQSDTYENVTVEEEVFQSQSEEESRSLFVQRMVREAEQKSLEKFGNRIGPVIEDEFRQLILPNMEIAIASVAEQFPREDLETLEITEVPSGGVAEKIFHIINAENKDIIRFHVRRDHPPLEGYWFNFHYHTHHDQFQKHYELGLIYWDKNTPPKWKS